MSLSAAPESRTPSPPTAAMSASNAKSGPKGDRPSHSSSKKHLQQQWDAPAEPAEAKKADVVKLTFPDGRVVELPLLEPKVGPPAIDVR